MKLAVPYYSQFIDVQDPFWMLRACGGISFKMVAEFHGATVPDTVTFCNEAKDNRGYDMANGWMHDYLVDKALQYGLLSERKEGLTNPDELISALSRGTPVIVSVEKRVLEQTRFHMVVLVGYDENSFIYHEPESTDKEKGQYRTCTFDQFMNYWRGKAIFISKN